MSTNLVGTSMGTIKIKCVFIYFQVDVNPWGASNKCSSRGNRPGLESLGGKHKQTSSYIAWRPMERSLSVSYRNRQMLVNKVTEEGRMRIRLI
jgi:hypothetical protein